MTAATKFPGLATDLSSSRGSVEKASPCAASPARPYFEWVPTQANISDPLSRDGLARAKACLLSKSWVHHAFESQCDLLKPHLHHIKVILAELGRSTRISSVGTSVWFTRDQVACVRCLTFSSAPLHNPIIPSEFDLNSSSN